MKYIIKFSLSVFVFSVLFLSPAQSQAQYTKSCTTNAECGGFGATCVSSPLGENSTAKNCRNAFCNNLTVQIIGANNQVVSGTTLQKGQSVRVTFNAKTNVNSFSAAMYNSDNVYSANNPKPIHTSQAHLQEFNMVEGSPRLADGNYHLIWSGRTSSYTATNSLTIPYDFFITQDLNTSNRSLAKRIQINGYFGDTANNYLSLPEPNCVKFITIAETACLNDGECTSRYGSNSYCKDGSCEPRPTITAGSPTTGQPTVAPAGSCPAGATCGANNTCGCSAGRYNCDNNWTNGCEATNKCTTGQVCTQSSDCASGVCKDNVCQPLTTTPGGTNPTTAPGNGNYCTQDSECGASGKCTNGFCGCQAGTYNCDGNWANGCESTSNTCQNPRDPSTGDGGYCKDNTSCGANAACSATGSCSCNAGFYNCDGNAANGCESTTACRTTQGTGNANLNIRVKFNGIGVNIPPNTDTVRARVQIFTNQMNAPVEQEVDFKVYGQEANGIRLFQAQVPFENIPLAGGYSIFIKGDHHIQKRICENNPTEVLDGRYRCLEGNITINAGVNDFDFTKIYQLAGDLPLSGEQSGFVDSLDITFLRANLGSNDQQDTVVGDMNLDGIVDTQDYSLGLYSLSFKYDEEIVGEDFR